jgi:hypothetical protein
VGCRGAMRGWRAHLQSERVHILEWQRRWQEWHGGQALERRYRVRTKRKYVYVCAQEAHNEHKACSLCASLARSCHVGAAHVGGEWAVWVGLYHQ